MPEQAQGSAFPHTGDPPLSRRELDVCIALCQGLKLSAIARRHNLSPKTVSTYRARLLEKTGAKNTAQLGIWAVMHGLAGGVNVGR